MEGDTLRFGLVTSTSLYEVLAAFDRHNALFRTLIETEVEVEQLLREIGTSVYGSSAHDFAQRQDAGERVWECVDAGIAHIPRQLQFVRGLHERLTELHRRLPGDFPTEQVEYFRSLLEFEHDELQLEASVAETLQTELRFWMRRREELNPKLMELLVDVAQLVGEASKVNTVEKVVVPAKPDSDDWKIPPHEVSVEFHEGGGLYRGQWLDAPVDVRKITDPENAFFEREAKLWDDHPKDVWQKLYEVALALEYLHERGIVHDGIKPDNVRVGHDGRAKLTRFESSLTTEQLAAEESVALRGDFRWHTPERVKGAKPSFTSDMYSLAMIIMVAVSGEPPFGFAVSDGEARKLLEQGKLPSRRGEFSDDQWSLVTHMNSSDSSAQVVMHQVVRRLRQFAAGERSARTAEVGGEDGSGVGVLPKKSDGMKLKWPETPMGVKKADAHSHIELSPCAASPRTVAGNLVRHLGKWLSADVILARVSSRDDDGGLAFQNNAELWFSLKHPNVQQLYGTCEQHKLFVCEYPESGNLSCYLRERPDQAWEKLFDIALGLRYLHYRRIIHGNLKCHHFLVGREGRAKLAGLECCLQGQEPTPAILRGEDEEEKEGETGRPSYESRWRAPECLRGQPESFSSDIYSLGKCFIETVTGELPEGAFRADIAVTGNLPVQPSVFGLHQWKLVEEMCSVDENKRPKIAEVVHQLGRFVAVDNAMKADVPKSISEIIRESPDQRATISAIVVKRMPKVEHEYADCNIVSTLSAIAKDALYRVADEDLNHTLEGYRQSSSHDHNLRDSDSAQEVGSLNVPERWHIEPGEVRRVGESIGQGGFAAVYRGEWMATTVAVKKLDNGRVGYLESFLKEVNLWYPLNHPHIINLYGACKSGDTDNRPFFVCDYASNGKLSSYLKQVDHKRELWRVLYECALGLQAVHARNIVHADLKCDNILVTATGQVKITDFGLSVCKEQGLSCCVTSTTNDATGAVRWTAPECLRGEEATTSSDVYAFGMCIIEAATGDLPWKIREDSPVIAHVLNGELPVKPRIFTHTEWKLVEAMCCSEPENRLSLDLALRVLETLARRSRPVEAEGA
ncbi:Leucine-rich repeat serine/threonine-protein kinase 2 [Phytophthora pseudosyringae]|uniref:Leucine-rich repeat serine/threonine-protein kinase 2 n=1 Tax=Phytophthora pseudosyringae TaxID=221518 RepID=A0A8T1V427_9STRA|nr:Leucine-rich repeat serine/threonine-protein kinase 2 [Phytophthora pseudosyringae]